MIRQALLSAGLAALACCGSAFVPVTPLPRCSVAAASTTVMSLQTRGDFIRAVGGAAAAAAVLAPLQVLAAEEVTTASGLKIKKLVNGKGAKADLGDLAAIRFKGRYKDFEFDNIFETDEPLYTRVGGGTLVKGMDEAIPMMTVGDRWELTIPGELGFGEKGRPPSPGRPRIPKNAELVYEVELISLPGKEGELFEAIGDDVTVDE